MSAKLQDKASPYAPVLIGIPFAVTPCEQINHKVICIDFLTGYMI